MERSPIRVIDQSVDMVYPFTTDINEQMKQCVYMTRISYRREDSESRKDPEDFVQGLINSNHYEPIEFVTIYSSLEDPHFNSLKNLLDSRASYKKDAHVRFSNNVYAFTLREVAEWFDELHEGCEGGDVHFSLKSDFWKLLKDNIISDKTFFDIFKNQPEELKRMLRVHYIITSNRQIMTEITRHRIQSKNWESTRHCNYSKDSFSCQLTFCNPAIYHRMMNDALTYEDRIALNDMNDAADSYVRIAEHDFAQAAYRLPSDIACKAGFAVYYDDLLVINKKRTTNYCGKPHEDAHNLVAELYQRIQDVYSHILIENKPEETKDQAESKSMDEIQDAEFISKLDISIEEKERLYKMLAEKNKSCTCKKECNNTQEQQNDSQCSHCKQEIPVTREEPRKDTTDNEYKSVDQKRLRDISREMAKSFMEHQYNALQRKAKTPVEKEHLKAVRLALDKAYADAEKEDQNEDLKESIKKKIADMSDKEVADELLKHIKEDPVSVMLAMMDLGRSGF